MSAREERVEAYYQQACWEGVSKHALAGRIVDLEDRAASLEADSKFLAALRANGVDNWDGYGLAFEDEDED